MMNYEEFKEKVVEEFPNYLPEEYKGVPIKQKQTKKVNQVLDTLYLDTGSSIAPMIYINNMYEYYSQTYVTHSFNSVMRRFVSALADVYKSQMAVPRFDKSRVVFQFVNTEMNRDMLQDVPHREFLDLSIIYRWFIGVDQDNFKSVIITSEFATNVGLTEHDLYTLAYENTKKLLSPTISSLVDFMQELVIGMSGDAVIPEIPMLVVTNAWKTNGAISIFFADVQEEIAEAFGSDFYILPSSTHEVLVLPEDLYKSCDFKSLVQEINQTEVEPEEKLSDSVYYYSRETKKISIC